MTRRQLLVSLRGGILAELAFSQSKLENLSFPLWLIEGTITPSNRFFVRDHFSPPRISLETWKLRIEGRVDNRFELDFSDLVELPSQKLEAVLECAGNPPRASAVSNGVWEGVPLFRLLERARPAKEAAFVLLEGADSGRLFEDTPPLPYSQIVPLSKCAEPTSLVAFRLNDVVLPVRNGFPARALFPGWYGMDSVKWLRRIVVLSPTDQENDFRKSGMDRLYNRIMRVNGKTRTIRISAIQVKSVFAWPKDGMELPVGVHRCWGFAWASNSPIRSVVISTDGGQSWAAAELDPQRSPCGWVKWHYSWAARAGEHVLMSRALDEKGNQQPLSRDPLRKDNYELNWCAPVRCSIR
jgi:DMSO/TMAO reductase YedYZ molybdopterin-dependent catalytic subunit